MICVRCIHCSYNNIAKGIFLLDKMAIFVLYRKIFIQIRAFESSVPLNREVSLKVSCESQIFILIFAISDYKNYSKRY